MFARTTERDLVPDRQELKSLPPRVHCILSAEIDIIRAPRHLLGFENQTLGGSLPSHPEKRYITGMESIIFVFRRVKDPSVIWSGDPSAGHEIASGLFSMRIDMRHTRQNGNQETRLL